MRLQIETDHLIACLLFIAVCALGYGFVSKLPGPAVTPAAPPPAPSVQPVSGIVWSAPAWTPTPAPPSTPRPTSLPCDETFRLAGALDAEGRGQPDFVRMAMSAIVVDEARSRSMTICELTEDTYFLSVWHYAQWFPGSWHAQQFAQPSESSVQIARGALGGQFNALRGGAMHFDGAWWDAGVWQCRPEVLWRGGTTCFYP